MATTIPWTLRGAGGLQDDTVLAAGKKALKSTGTAIKAQKQDPAGYGTDRSVVEDPSVTPGGAGMAGICDAR